MVDFDIILAMDCLSVSRAVVDSESGMVTFKLSSWERLVFRGSSTRESLWVISVLRAKNMTQLNKKGKPFVWTPACEESFQELKRRLVSTPVITVHDGTCNLIV